MDVMSTEPSIESGWDGRPERSTEEVMEAVSLSDETVTTRWCCVRSVFEWYGIVERMGEKE